MRGVRLAVLLLALVLPVGDAVAFDIQGLSDLSNVYAQDEGIRFSLAAELREWKALSADSVPAVAGWLADAVLQLDFSKTSYALRLERLGRELFSMVGGASDEQSLLVLGKEGIGFTSSPQDDPLLLLLGEDKPDLRWFFNPSGPERLRDLPEAVKASLEPYAKEVRRKATVKNVGVSPLRYEYRLAEEEWGSIWPVLKEALVLSLEGLPVNAQETFDSLRFDKQVLIKRLIDSGGESLGWELSADVVLPSGQVRELSYASGYAPGKGLSLKLKAPATRGKDDLSLSFSATLDEQTLNADFFLASRLDAERCSLKGSAKLKLSNEEGGQRLSGRLWAENKRGSEDTRRLTLEPDFRFDGRQARGTMRVLQERGGKARLDLMLNAALAPSVKVELPAFTRAYDLQADLLAAQAEFSGSLLPLIKEFLMDFPEPARLLLLHDMGRTTRTQGETVPAGDQAPQYLVTEDAF